MPTQLSTGWKVFAGMGLRGPFNVIGMDIFQAFVLLNSNGVNFLRALAERSPYDVASYGISLSTAKKYTKLADVLFGPTTSPRLQRESVALAEERGLSADHLVMIDRHAKSLDKRGATWKLRAELIAHEGSYEDVNKLGGQRAKEINGAKPKQAGVKIGRAENGMRTMTITADQRKITDFEKTLDAHESEKPRSQALLEAFWNHVEGNQGLAKPIYRPVIAIGLDDFEKVSSGSGDEVIVGLSDGTTMTGSELIEAAFAGALGENIYAGLFHPTAGPVNLYEARFASFKQRIMATAENLVCPWPDCGVPADRCQVHHMDAHKNGGQTNPTNLTMLCKYHNGVNDDSVDPGRRHKSRRSRGRMRRHRRKVRLHTPGGKLLANTHDLSKMGAMNLI